ncbi:MAG: PhnD/SsuA/transferrin family substrate-binding protein [Candidatus Krumholzibacteriota bacterium]|nr:PhnD/SsuA/transferrin family substrate-binding protein [Candidatus Krumholzibacteriota bacterium]
MDQKRASSRGRKGSRVFWINFFLYSIVILLASAAYFLKPDYMAHVPVRIGITACDSVFAAPILDRYSRLVREKGGGDIAWFFFGDDEEPAGCDFYLMTSPQARVAVNSKRMKLSLAACATEARSHSVGVVITRKGTGIDQLSGGKFIFSFRNSASGFLSPLKALADHGIDLDTDSDDIEFTGCRSCDERIVYGVLFGEYVAGGIDLDRFKRIESLGFMKKGEVSILLTGTPVPHEIFLLSSTRIERWKEKRFIDRLPAITAGAPADIKNDLRSIGIAAFIPAGENSLDFLDRFSDSTGTGSDHSIP